jgi:hypothetical protein
MGQAIRGGQIKMFVDLKIGKIFMIILSVFIIDTVPAILTALDDAGSLRCDRESIMTGDTDFQVKTACGKPDSILIKGSARQVWIYNFGPTEFVYYLTFVNGRLERIQVGEYGDYHGKRIID